MNKWVNLIRLKQYEKYFLQTSSSAMKSYKKILNIFFWNLSFLKNSKCLSSWTQRKPSLGIYIWLDTNKFGFFCFDVYWILAEVPGVAREVWGRNNSNFLSQGTPEVPMGFLKQFKPIWSSRLASHIYINRVSNRNSIARNCALLPHAPFHCAIIANKEAIKYSRNCVQRNCFSI